METNKKKRHDDAAREALQQRKNGDEHKHNIHGWYLHRVGKKDYRGPNGVMVQEAERDSI